ncbi:LysM peptidoglycan-binding domain-containing protein [Nocardioides rubriscoriae]|uniref:LysM peptidoglycan-binding domain-containing protein n=1 Tax=Nocardioides rubriscoriae TaxID=642762 RepID=UPI0011DFA49B|nr:LysM peptidoglycan-binding domain-containing protein [Nocardioides rubriscoriae]
MSTITAPHVPAYRLTRRGRVVVFLFAFLALIALALVFAGGSMATSEPEATQTVVVEPGQTLWSIAADVSDGRDVRDMMDHLVDLNELDSVALGAGQHLEVPVD